MKSFLTVETWRTYTKEPIVDQISLTNTDASILYFYPNDNSFVRHRNGRNGVVPSELNRRELIRLRIVKLLLQLQRTRENIFQNGPDQLCSNDYPSSGRGELAGIAVRSPLASPPSFERRGAYLARFVIICLSLISSPITSAASSLSSASFSAIQAALRP